jgi:hypothetical protein
MEHDRAKEKVYGATLQVSLAAGAPKEVLAENRALMEEFVKMFAEDVKEPEAILKGADQLAGQDESRQMVFVGEESKVTLWNDKTGVYTVNVESAHAG